MNEAYWDRQPTDKPYELNGFNGTWAFTDHRKVPGGLRDFIMECFPKLMRFSRVDIEKVNELMNDVWEGPGSMSKIARLHNEMRAERQRDPDEEPVKKDKTPVPTIDDYSDEEKRAKVSD